MKTIITSIFFLAIMSFTFLSCSKESPVQPQATSSDMQTDGEDESSSFCPLINYGIVQDFMATPISGTKDDGGSGSGSPVSVVLLEGVTRVCTTQQFNSWDYESIHFTPNQAFVSGNYSYTPLNSTVYIYCRYTYSPFGSGLFNHAIRNKLYSGSTLLGTFGDITLPSTMPTGGYLPPVAETYTTTGTAVDHELQIGLTSFHW